MKSELPNANLNSRLRLSCARVTISPWVNERLPPWNAILTAHDVARLTRRSKWMILGLTWMRRFPKKRIVHGRKVGWLRADVLAWMTKGLTTLPTDQPANLPVRSCKRRKPEQPCPPFECSASGAKRRRSSIREMDDRNAATRGLQGSG